MAITNLGTTNTRFVYERDVNKNLLNSSKCYGQNILTRIEVVPLFSLT